MQIGRIAVAALASLLAVLSPAGAEDRLTLALGQRGNWDTAISELGQRAGIFRKHGLALDILWTQGAGESQQALLAGSADVGLVSTLQAFGGYSKGVPVRIVAAEATGAADYWYVRADSAIHSMKDTAGRTVAYSTNGASTHTMALAFLAEAGVTAKPVATGSPSATLTQVMSGQIDVGWAAPPFGLEQINKGEIRVVAYGKDLASVRGQTIRVLMTLADKLDARPGVFARYVQGYRETVDWMYAGEEPLKMYAEFAGVPLEIARQVRDKFFPKSLLMPDQVVGIDSQMQDAVTFKYLAAPLAKDQIAELIRIPPLPK